MSQDPVVKLLIVFLTTPASDFYLPKQILQSQNPKLEPFSAGTVPLGTHDLLGSSIDITLSNLVVTGIANIQVAKSHGKPMITVDGSTVSFVASHPNTEAPPQGVPSSLTLTCDFLGNVDGVTLPGKLNVTVKSLNIDGTFEATSDDGDVTKADIRFTKLFIDTHATPSNIILDLKIQSAFEAFINSLLNSASILTKVMAGINAQMSSAQVLHSLSQAATQAARKALANGPL